VCVTVSLFFFMILRFAATEQEGYLYNPVGGFSGVNAALAVALHQRMAGQSVIPREPFSVFKFEHLPFTVCLIAVLLVGGKEAPLCVFGTLWGWFYLRFSFEDPETGAVGDMRDEFRCSALFPDVWKLRAAVDLLAGFIYNSCLQIGCLQASANTASAASKPQKQPDSSPAQLLGITVVPASLSPSAASTGSIASAAALPLPAVALKPADPAAERRRALAIKAIDQRLAELQQKEEALPLDEETLKALSAVSDTENLLKL